MSNIKLIIGALFCFIISINSVASNNNGDRFSTVPYRFHLNEDKKQINDCKSDFYVYSSKAQFFGAISGRNHRGTPRLRAAQRLASDGYHICIARSFLPQIIGMTKLDYKPPQKMVDLFNVYLKEYEYLDEGETNPDIARYRKLLAIQEASDKKIAERKRKEAEELAKMEKSKAEWEAKKKWFWDTLFSLKTSISGGFSYCSEQVSLLFIGDAESHASNT